MNANATATLTETRVQIGNGEKVHRGMAEGNTRCGYGLRMGRRSTTRVLPADTPVTCTQCDPNAAATPAPAPTAPAQPGRCEQIVYGAPCGARLMRTGECGLCDPK